jgi:hypothetical protein
MQIAAGTKRENTGIGPEYNVILRREQMREHGDALQQPEQGGPLFLPGGDWQGVFPDQLSRSPTLCDLFARPALSKV